MDINVKNLNKSEDIIYDDGNNCPEKYIYILKEHRKKFPYEKNYVYFIKLVIFMNFMI